MDRPLSFVVSRVTASGRVTPADVLSLRPLVWRDGQIGEDEADALFAINDACYATCPEWLDFFVEAGTSLLVAQTPPIGYVDDVKAQWLMAQIDKDGKVEQLGELLLLISVIEHATNMPDSLKAYAIAQVERTVLTGAGPTRNGMVLKPGVIDQAEVDLLRRILFAPGSEGAAGISKSEAEVLFRIKDATLGAANAPSWERLFVQLVGHYLMVEQTHEQLSPARAAELERFMDDAMPNIGRFLGRMEEAFVHPQSMVEAFASSRVGPGTDTAPTMTADEAHWLKLHIADDGQLDALEKALLAFIIDESGPLPAELRAPDALRA